MYAMNMECCGIKEIDGLSGTKNYETAFINLLKECDSFDPNTLDEVGGFCRFFIFSQATQRPSRGGAYGEKFKRWILKNKLGSVHAQGGDLKNPNSGRFLKIFIWTVDWAGVKKWLKADDSRTSYWNDNYGAYL